MFDHVSPPPAGYFSPLPRRTSTDMRNFSTTAGNAAAMLQHQQHPVSMPLQVGDEGIGDFMPKFPPPMFDSIPDIADSNSVYEYVHDMDAAAASMRRAAGNYPMMYPDINQHHHHNNHHHQ